MTIKELIEKAEYGLEYGAVGPDEAPSAAALIAIARLLQEISGSINTATFDLVNR